MSIPSSAELLHIISQSTEQPLAMRHYPSRGQSAIQKIYLTKSGKIFLKKTSDRNIRDCQINKDSATLAEREYWAWRLANHLGLDLPWMVLIDVHTTVQNWLDYPDANLFKSLHGRLILNSQDVFDHCLFDWLTGQQDRHDANYLYNQSQKKIILVDSAFSFLKHDGSMPDYLSYHEASSTEDLKTNLKTSFLKKITVLSRSKLRSLVPLRDPLESDALWTRKQRLESVICLQDVLDLYRRQK